MAERRDDMHVVAVCDRYFKDIGTLDDGVRHYPTYHGLLAEDLDALFVCISNDMASEVTVAGLEAGLHVFCEKPPAVTWMTLPVFWLPKQRRLDRS